MQFPALRGTTDDAVLAQGLSWGIISRVLGVGISLGSTALAVRGVGLGAYGVIGSLTAFTSILGFADFGIGSAVTRHLAGTRLTSSAERIDARKVVSAAAVALAAIGAAIFAGALIFINVVDIGALLGARTLRHGEAEGLFMIFSASVALGVVATLGQRICLGLRRSREWAFWVLGSSVASLCCITACFVGNSPSWLFMVSLAAVPNAVLLVQTLLVLRREYLFGWRDVNFTAVRSVGGVGFSFLLLNLSVAVGYSADAAIVGSVLGSTAAASFVLGMKLCNLVTNTLGSGLVQVWPSMGLAAAEGRIAWLRSRFVAVLLGTIGLGGAALGGVVWLGPRFGQALFGEGSLPDRNFLLLAAAWGLYNLGMTLASYLLIAAGPLRLIGWLSIIMAVANVLGSVWLTNVIGLVGPILSSLVTHVAFIGIISVVLCVKILRPRQMASESDYPR